MAGVPVLRWGSEGDSVVDLQGWLTALGYDPGASDGVFGPRTDDAARAFQADHGLVAAGIVGPLTWAALDAGSGSQAPPPSPTSSGPAEDHAVFVTDPVVTGLILTYRAARLDGNPIAAGSGVDVWSIDADGTPMLANGSETVPFTDATRTDAAR